MSYKARRTHRNLKMSKDQSSIRLFPDPVLRKSSAFVKKFDSSLQQTVRFMHKVMKSQPSGIGIAAPQLGINLRVAIIDISTRVNGKECLYLINPEIIMAEDPITSREGCMSLPEYTSTIQRYNQIKVRWQNLNGHTDEKMFQDLEARCIQHEIDHLNGILFIDRVTSLKTDLRPRSARVR